MPSLYLLPLSILAVVICRRALAFVKDLGTIQYHVGKRQLVSVQSVLTAFLPPLRWITEGANSRIRLKHSQYERFGWDVISEVAVIGQRTIVFSLADADVVREVTASSRGRFVKPVEIYERTEIYGPHIISAEGEQWKKYKKLVSPAFTERNNRLVFKETVNILSELFEDVWRDKDIIELDHCTSLTYKIALLVLGAAVFGNKPSWETEPGPKGGHRMTFNQALHGMTSDFYLSVILPASAMGLTERFRKARVSFEELGAHLTETLEEKKNSPDSEGKSDLFSIILANNEDSDDKLPDAAVKGNIFIFLIAGHETTAHTLAFTFALLSMYPEEQEALYTHITSVLEGRLVPSYEDLPRLTRCTAVLYETMRLFPPITSVPKSVAEDTTLDITNRKGEKKTIPVPKGSTVLIDAAGMHYNPRYWKDPLSFNPERFLRDYRRDAFIPFSSGPRACPGRRFFETEAVAVMAMFISKYKVSIKEEPQFSSETFEQRYERIFASKEVLTLTPTRVPLVFTKRV
ncbi:cytochrome P450 [Coprinopsis marcescibilis]|uniref:Cytochrome P450 n=1 Tax=Coprinopsis marcescibilis TaxID=230819 RepID=A0A5C3L644_COPMA|nr:cytochrome P450 [Coprinopsis marcescibilis]